jgi:hypothetical protein
MMDSGDTIAWELHIDKHGRVKRLIHMGAEVVASGIRFKYEHGHMPMLKMWVPISRFNGVRFVESDQQVE